MRRVRVSSHQSPVHKLGDAQMTLSPKFRLAVAPPPSSTHPSSSSSSSSLESDFSWEPLIPGLPDDVALNCLLRLPIESHPTCRSVCRRWHLLLGSKEGFFSRRKGLGFRDPWLFVFASHRTTGKIRWQVLDLTRLSWHTIPSMPCRDRVCPRGSGCVAIPDEGALLVCGGTTVVSDAESSPSPPLDLVLKYEIHRNRWTVMNRMLIPRSFFANAVIDGRVYAAGGNGSDLSELSSAEVLDGNCWHPIASMGTGMATYDAAVLDGKLLVTEGWVWPFLFSPRGQVYDPKSDSWEAMEVGLLEGWTGSSVVVDGHLFVISEHENMRVKVYDMGSDSWETVDGSPVPGRIRRPFSVSVNPSSNHRIHVVGHGLHIAVGHVQRVSCRTISSSSSSTSTSGRRWSFCIRWQEIDAPGELCDLTPCSTQVLFA